MPTLVKIGHDYWVVKNPSAAAAVINALAGAIKVRNAYTPGRPFFYPDEHQDEIGMMTVLPEQLVASKPSDHEAAAMNQARQHPGRKLALRLCDSADKKQ